MKAPKRKPRVQLSEKEENAFFIIGRVASALKKAGADEEYIKEFTNEATSGDYDNLLITCLKYADVS